VLLADGEGAHPELSQSTGWRTSALPSAFVSSRPRASFTSTISVGAALLLDSDRSTNDLLDRADERLHLAKSSGRNRVST
jgi:PleD family two-component response regulator